MSLPVISLVGRPNVGKSTLFNRLSKSRKAIVSDFEGLTRDRQYATIDLKNGARCSIIDTGGMTNKDDIIDYAIHNQIVNALDESDIVYFIVSARDGVTALDIDIAKQLRKLKINLILVCNKTEGLSEESFSEFYELGLGKPIPIAAEHGQGIEDLIDITLPLLPDFIEEDIKVKGIAVAIFGRPNVGKSTLINRILGEDRVLAIDIPGTTRDTIFIPFERESQLYTLIDTAGIRRKRSVNEKIEKFSILKAIEALENCHVVVLVLDASEGVTEQDATILGMISDKGRALLIVNNKWDGLDDYQKNEVKRKLDIKLSFVNYASVHYISALHGSGVGKLFKTINKAYENAGARFSTPMLNDTLAKANEAHLPPPVSGRRLKLKYIHQSGVFPPTFTVHGNHLKTIPNAYIRYLQNFFTDALGISNTPIKFEFKSAENPFKNKKNKLTNRQIQKRKRLIKFTKKRK